MKKIWLEIASCMDDVIREQVHDELVLNGTECTEAEFLKRYLELDPEFKEIIVGVTA